MTARITEIVVDAADAERLAGFWADVLGWCARKTDEAEVEWLVAPEGERAPLVLLFVEVPEPKTVKNRVHLDVNAIGVDQATELERLFALGARTVDIGQGEQTWVVLADPEGNEFCLLSRTVDPS